MCIYHPRQPPPPPHPHQSQQSLAQVPGTASFCFYFALYHQNLIPAPVIMEKRVLWRILY